MDSADPPNPAPAPTITVGVISVGAVHHEVACNGEYVPLTPMEFGIVRKLTEHLKEVVSKERLMNTLYGASDDAPHAKIIDVFICKARKRFADAGCLNVIETIWGRGYQLGPCTLPPAAEKT